MNIPNDKIKEDILKNLPPEMSSLLTGTDFSDLREIRLRTGRQAMLYYGKRTLSLGKTFSAYNISEIFSAICKSSVYAYLSEIQNGFITLSGGHRIGFGGECVTEGGRITNIHNISGISIRIAREFKGCALPLMPYIEKNKDINNTILIAPPACGKTTMLRDIARILSSRMKITIIDERSELGALFCGTPQFDLGPQTDVISRAPKSLGMIMALRALSPDVIITDEVGTAEDAAALEQVLGAGCKIVTSIHGYSAESIRKSKGKLLSLFDTAIELTKKNGIPQISQITHTEDSTYD